MISSARSVIYNHGVTEEAGTAYHGVTEQAGTAYHSVTEETGSGALLLADYSAAGQTVGDECMLSRLAVASVSAWQRTSKTMT